MKYKFQGLLYRNKKGEVSGAMSPVLFAKEVAPQLGIKLHGLARVENPQNDGSHTYDHLVIKYKYRRKGVESAAYALVVDMGHEGIPVALKFMDDPKDEVTVTPIYRKQITPERMEYHRENMEYPRWAKDFNPIVVLTDKEINELLIQASESDEFEIKNGE